MKNRNLLLYIIKASERFEFQNSLLRRQKLEKIPSVLMQKGNARFYLLLDIMKKSI